VCGSQCLRLSVWTKCEKTLHFSVVVGVCFLRDYKYEVVGNI
jgi:hypothetical protein